MDGIVTYANDALCEFLGVLRKDIEGKKERDAWKLGADEPSVLEECLRQREPIRAAKIRVSRNGKKTSLVASATPRRTSAGEIKGAFAVYRDLVEEVRLTGELLDATEGVTEVQTSVAEISTAAQEQVTTATQQKTTVAQVSTTAVELASASKQVAESCAQIAEATVQLLRTAKNGQDLLERVMANLVKVQEMTKVAGDQIFGLSDRSKRVNSVVDLINGVAAETKLIAFNAAIEAARAGEAGRGFGVVATEVKSLAVSVAESGKEIKNLVGDILSSINRAVLTAEGQVKLVEEMGHIAESSNAAFGEIVTGIAQVADRAAVISASTQQQRNATDQLTVSMEELSSAASHTASAAKQTMAAVAMLSDFAVKLAGALERFKEDG
jgi:methyl-accepting chemotaxis protein